MLTLTRLYLRVARRIEGPLEKFADPLFKSADSESRKFFPTLKETGVVVQVRAGTVEIIAVLTVTGIVICNYPKFRKGFLMILDDAREAGRSIRSIIVKRLELEPKKIQASRVTTGQLTQIFRLGRRVEEKEMSTEDAHEKALCLLELTDEEVPEDLSQWLLTFFKDAARKAKTTAPPPRRARRVAAVMPRRRRFYRRGVELERKLGEKKISRRYWP